MQTKSTYEEIVLKELRGIPGEALPQIIKIIKSLKQTILTARKQQDRGEVSGLCGAWLDDRSAEEIIDDIRSHRSGFGGRQVSL